MTKIKIFSYNVTIMAVEGLYWQNLIDAKNLNISGRNIGRGISEYVKKIPSAYDQYLLTWSMITGKSTIYTNRTIVANLGFDVPIPYEINGIFSPDPNVDYSITTNVTDSQPTENANRKKVTLEHTLNAHNHETLKFSRQVLSLVEAEKFVPIDLPQRLVEDMPGLKDRNKILNTKYSSFQSGSQFNLAENVVFTQDENVRFSNLVDNMSPLHRNGENAFGRPIANSNLTIMNLLQISNLLLPEGVLPGPFKAETRHPVFTVDKKFPSGSCLDVTSQIKSITKVAGKNFYEVVIEIIGKDKINQHEKNPNSIKITQTTLWPSSYISN